MSHNIHKATDTLETLRMAQDRLSLPGGLMIPKTTQKLKFRPFLFVFSSHVHLDNTDKTENEVIYFRKCGA